MFKKFSSVLFAVMIAGTAFAQVEAPTDSLGIHPWDGEENDNHVICTNQSHWSMYLGAGFNVFDGDYINDQKHTVWFPSATIGGAYHWNSTWGIGAEYTFRQYRATGGKRECDADILLEGMSHQAGAYVSFDIFNAFRPQNKRKIFALDILAGGGAVWKKNSIYYENVYYVPITTDTWWKDGQTAAQKAAGETKHDDKYNVYGVFMAGLSAEFNLSRFLELGIRGMYNYTTSDYIDGRKRSNNNDGWFDTEILLRFKFAPRRKSHVRNLVRDDMIKNWNDGIYYQDPEMGEAKRAKAQQKANPCGHVRDTLYIITRDTVYVVSEPQTTIQTMMKDAEKYTVFFENNVPELDKVALTTTSEAAVALIQDSTKYAVVIGSCDNTGTMEYNQWLAVQRANNVTTTLADMGVNIDRIYTVGRGIMQDDRAEGSYSVNRRVDILLVSAEDWAKAKDEYAYFEQYKQVKKGSAVRNKTTDKYASSSEVLKTAIQNMKQTGVAMSISDIVNTIIEPAPADTVEAVEPAAPADMVKAAELAPVEEVVMAEVDKAIESAKSDVLGTVIVTPQMTLSKLARKYYNNTNMWVKIFEANRDVIESPNHLEDGMKLIIPRL